MLRIGVNLGDVVAEGSDLYGDGVNIAARGINESRESRETCWRGIAMPNARVSHRFAEFARPAPQSPCPAGQQPFNMEQSGLGKVIIINGANTRGWGGRYQRFREDVLSPNDAGHHTSRPWQHLIAIIGDSWATRSKLDDGIGYRCLEAGVLVIVKSDGLHGGTTDQVLTRFTSRIGMLRFLDLYYKDLRKLLVIAAGINDVVSHRGCEFYCSNIMRIVRLAAERDIEPYIIELPDIDIEAMEGEQNASAGSLKRTLFRWFNDRGEADVVARYREALRNRVSGLARPVNINAFANRNTPEKFIDRVHLYPKLLDSLGELVADALVPDLLQSTTPAPYVHERRVGA